MSNSTKELIALLILVILSMIVGIIAGYSFCYNQYKMELVKRNLAEYNIKTGEWQFKTNHINTNLTTLDNK